MQLKELLNCDSEKLLRIDTWPISDTLHALLYNLFWKCSGNSVTHCCLGIYILSTIFQKSVSLSCCIFLNWCYDSPVTKMYYTYLIMKKTFQVKLWFRQYSISFVRFVIRFVMHASWTMFNSFPLCIGYKNWLRLALCEPIFMHFVTSDCIVYCWDVAPLHELFTEFVVYFCYRFLYLKISIYYAVYNYTISIEHVLQMNMS